ncbi:hypothetical protein ILUMI_04636 [Ignelater luminosus]|uniref:USP domain-containing protein n=1 Tax=Ignelater luminosus TaxID=2038154 RepID=A0A8K0GKY8_IGNLU|nr:hypothetical protein ILUMI_04636 [Ignelater luminosus]
MESLQYLPYIEKLENIARVLLTHESDSVEYLQLIWSAQLGKQDEIVRNVYVLLRKLASHLSIPQVDWLSDRLFNFWPPTDVQHQNRILDLFLVLSRNDLDETTIQKLLTLLWDLSHRDDLTSAKINDIFDIFMAILQFHYDDSADSPKHNWLSKCVTEFKENNNWELPSIILMHKLCATYMPCNESMSAEQQLFSREKVAESLQNENAIVAAMTYKLAVYTSDLRSRLTDNPHLIDADQLVDENPPTPPDREVCLQWLQELASEEIKSDETTIDEIFVRILSLPLTTITMNSFRCFEEFFIAENVVRKMMKRQEHTVLVLHPNLIGLNYIWEMILHTSDVISASAIKLLGNVSVDIDVNCSTPLLSRHESYIKKCYDMLKQHYDAYSMEEVTDIWKLTKMFRILKALCIYVKRHDKLFQRERNILPLYRACRELDIILIIQFLQNATNRNDFEILTHKNDTLLTVQTRVLEKIGSNYKIELFHKGRILNKQEYSRRFGDISFQNKTVLQVNVIDPDPNTQVENDPRLTLEELLPSVLMSNNPTYHLLLCQLHELGRQKHPLLQDYSMETLQLIASDSEILELIYDLFGNLYFEDNFEILFLNTTPTEILYNLRTLYAILMPANRYLEEDVKRFRLKFIINKKTLQFFNMFGKDFLPNCDNTTRCSIYLEVIKICKFILITICFLLEMASRESTTGSKKKSPPETFVQNGLENAFPDDSNMTLLEVTRQLASDLIRLLENDPSVGKNSMLLKRALAWRLPSYTTVTQLIRLLWASSSGNFSLLHETSLVIHANCVANLENVLDFENLSLYKKTVQLLSIAVLTNPNSLELLCHDKMLPVFLGDLLLLNPNHMLRMTTAQQFLLIIISTDKKRKVFQKVRNVLFALVNDPIINKYASTANEMFYLLCQMIQSDKELYIADLLLDQEILWLKNVTVSHAVPLEGHLRLTETLVDSVNCNKKMQIGSKSGGNLIRVLLEKFLFPASTALRDGDSKSENVLLIPVCNTPSSKSAAFSLLKALCNQCNPNYELMSKEFDSLFFSDGNLYTTGWENTQGSQVQTQEQHGFVGLQNGGATCYMNAVLQQLFMEKNISDNIIAFEVPSDQDVEIEECADPENFDQDRYNLVIFKIVKEIFTQLKYSQMKYYEPNNLWKHFQIDGEQIQLEEQQDAVNFYLLLINCMNEALFRLNGPPILLDSLGGTFSDQKICKECPHRYSREEPFSILSVNIKHHTSLISSLNEYIEGKYFMLSHYDISIDTINIDRGDQQISAVREVLLPETLDGENAYFCEICQRKVATTKRLIIKDLPNTLVIQLKRFEYDYTEGGTRKSNDYFQFPRNLNMLPFTVLGLMREGEDVISCDIDEAAYCTTYQLTGVVIHRGEATDDDWFQFDDKQVRQVNLQSDQELSRLCFGGVFDVSSGKKNYSAYMLFYTRDFHKFSEMVPPGKNSAAQVTIENKDMQYMHRSNQLTEEYIAFIRKLIHDNVPPISTTGYGKPSEASKISMEIGSKYLFQIGWRTAVKLRGPAVLWSDALCLYLQSSAELRMWFTFKILFRTPETMFEYLVHCPVIDVRIAFRNILIVLTGLLHNDGPCCPPPVLANPRPNATMGHHIICYLLQLLPEIPSQSDFILSYCEFFLLYAEQGEDRVRHLLDSSVVAVFMMAAIDGGLDSNVKYKPEELVEIHRVVFTLVRSSDCTFAHARRSIKTKPNKYSCGKGFLLPLEDEAREMLFDQNKNVIDCQDDMVDHYGSLLLGILSIPDSLQVSRLENFFSKTQKSVGMLNTIIDLTNKNPQRAYCCIKLIVQLFLKCKPAVIFLMENIGLLTIWYQGVDWLDKQIKAGLESASNSNLKRTDSMPQIVHHGYNLKDILVQQSEMLN